MSAVTRGTSAPFGRLPSDYPTRWPVCRESSIASEYAVLSGPSGKRRWLAGRLGRVWLARPCLARPFRVWPGRTRTGNLATLEVNALSIELRAIKRRIQGSNPAMTALQAASRAGEVCAMSVPDRTRTCGLHLRRVALYPTGYEDLRR